jgi:hypothetical protein
MTFALLLTLSTNSWAQAPENGTTLTQAEAEPYLQENWDDKSKLQYFSVDAAASTNIQSVFTKIGSAITHVRMARGIIENTHYIFTIGVTAEGMLQGDYYLSKTPLGAVLGPCPRNCDTQ